MSKFIVTLFLVSGFCFAQVTSFKPGEVLTYSVSFNGKGISADVLQIKTKVSNVNVKGKKLMKLYGDAITYSNFDHVFKIRDYFESYVYPNSLEPVYFVRSTNENNYKKEEVYNFKRKKSANVTVGIKTTRKGTVSDPDFAGYSENKQISVNFKAKDVLSLLYYLRALPLAKMNIPKGKSIKLDLLFDGKVKTMSIRYLGTQTIKTVLGNKKCYKFTTAAQGDTNSVSGTIYLTADANKVPVLIEANIPLGKGKIKLQSATGLRN